MLTLITGPMGASKTDRLCQLYRKAEAAGRHPLALQLSGSARPGTGPRILSRTGSEVPAVLVRDLLDVSLAVTLHAASERPGPIVVDELHRWVRVFGLASVLELLMEWRGRYELGAAVAALDYDLHGEPYEPASFLTSRASIAPHIFAVETLAAPCMEPAPGCWGALHATRSLCLTDEEPPPIGDLARLGDDGSWIGGKYAALCERPFEARRALPAHLRRPQHSGLRPLP